MLQKIQISIELFDAITGECILENPEDCTYKGFPCKTINTMNFNKVCNTGIINLIYQKTLNKNMGIKESRNVYIA